MLLLTHLCLHVLDLNHYLIVRLNSSSLLFVLLASYVVEADSCINIDLFIDLSLAADLNAVNARSALGVGLTSKSS